ncbi:MAG TPA: pyridoxamine 5'-phosphate oxidase family protein, partial [Anaerolineales bacterium]|nr:pyridoxamine 5'-phosphate oxidase family protein [Anaerolineales bacterium]
MAKTHPHITDAIRAFIERQHLFFVASAPLSGEGHVNLSPKGLDCFRVLGPDRVAYLDVIGSGNETSAHLLENGRITFMFCAFDGPPNIVRLYGRGHVVLPSAEGWDELAARVMVPPAARQFIVADITRVQTSCGFGVPLFDLKGHREHMAEWA